MGLKKHYYLYTVFYLFSLLSFPKQMSDHTLPAITTLAQLRSARVKSIDFHPTKTQVLIGCYSGEVILYDYKVL